MRAANIPTLGGSVLTVVVDGQGDPVTAWAKVEVGDDRAVRRDDGSILVAMAIIDGKPNLIPVDDALVPLTGIPE